MKQIFLKQNQLDFKSSEVAKILLMFITCRKTIQGSDYPLYWSLLWLADGT